MPAGNLDLYVEQGVDFKRPFNISTDGQSEDLTDHSFYGEIRPYPGGGLTSTFTVTVLDQTTDRGNVEVSLSAADTAKLPTKRSPIGDRVPTELTHDIIHIFPDGKSERILSGKFTISPGVTRPRP